MTSAAKLKDGATTRQSWIADQVFYICLASRKNGENCELSEPMASRHAIAALLLRENCSLYSSSRLSPSLSGPVRAQLTLSRRALHTPPSQLCPFAFSLEARRAAVGRCWSSRGLRHKSGKPTPSFKQHQFEDVRLRSSFCRGCRSNPPLSPIHLPIVHEQHRTQK